MAGLRLQGGLGVTARDRERRTAVRATRRLRVFSTAVTVLLVFAVLAAGLAYGQRQTALAQQRTALSRQLAAQSTALADTDPDLAALLAVEAYRTSPTREAETRLYAMESGPLVRTFPDCGTCRAPVFRPDGRILALDSDEIRLFDPVTGRTKTILSGYELPRSWRLSAPTAVPSPPAATTAPYAPGTQTYPPQPVRSAGSNEPSTATSPPRNARCT
ncbi:hypothetical protein OG562_15530 [Streptomyces sp. NBC_01275]|uniref:hypothetical protein n=1 Tax=Streptomyces sp. NBC_01275 TaxID=2903807 RepID=UPI00224E2321|nr:hypothetical protein [Streptomyces sp. NBC_01275]MCX4762362.1 hypothetical protein [Streptomyces sp. NBC_01275]